MCEEYAVQSCPTPSCGALHNDRPEIDVYRILIDSYRMRIEDEYVFEQKNTSDSIYGGAKTSIRGFEKYLRLFKARPGLLPP
ncbi:hypothetical protein F5Y17DRAFT_458034 [Xylariaceae sp. FL0594]|nr:hypothetical protein F5Y17DRAFT_458034 [Xylariaceae sp. FL0594]